MNQKPSFPAVVGGGTCLPAGRSMDPPDNRRTPEVWRPLPVAAGDDVWGLRSGDEFS